MDQTSEMLEILETDTPAVRLLKSRAYLMAAGELLKRVIFVVVSDVSISKWHGLQLKVIHRNLPSPLMRLMGLLVTPSQAVLTGRPDSDS